MKKVDTYFKKRACGSHTYQCYLCAIENPVAVHMRLAGRLLCNPALV